MDPVSLTASVIAIVSFSSQICSAISSLRSLCKTLPGRLHAVNNEVADLELVLSQVATLVEGRASLPESRYSAVPHLLKQARSKLSEVDDIVKRLTEIFVKSKTPLSRMNAWRKEQDRLQRLQDDIHTVKSSLNIMLGATHTYVFS